MCALTAMYLVIYNVAGPRSDLQGTVVQDLTTLASLAKSVHCCANTSCLLEMNVHLNMVLDDAGQIKDTATTRTQLLCSCVCTSALLGLTNSACEPAPMRAAPAQAAPARIAGGTQTAATAGNAHRRGAMPQLPEPEPIACALQSDAALGALRSVAPLVIARLCPQAGG